MMLQDIATLYEYNRWANGRTLEAAEKLDPTAFVKDLKNSFSLGPGHAGAHPGRGMDLAAPLEGGVAGQAHRGGRVSDGRRACANGLWPWTASGQRS